MNRGPHAVKRIARGGGRHQILSKSSSPMSREVVIELRGRGRLSNERHGFTAAENSVRGARVQRAAMLAAILTGASPVGGNYPVATVAITGDGAGDQTVESPVVKILEGWV